MVVGKGEGGQPSESEGRPLAPLAPFGTLSPKCSRKPPSKRYFEKKVPEGAKGAKGGMDTLDTLDTLDTSETSLR